MESPPPAGISEIGEDGSRKALPKTKAAQGRGHRGQRRDEVLKNPEAGRRVATSAPAGVDTRQNDIVEFDIHTKRSERHFATFTSVDGEEYSFRMRDQKGKVLAGLEPFVSMIAIVELMKGGNPLVVFKAFKIKIPAESGKLLFPVAEEHRHLIQAPDLVELEQGGEHHGFELGDSD